MLKYELAKDIKPSPAEKKLALKLIEYGVFFEQEIMFDKCINPITGKRLRFDFYIPDKRILIEYDGVGWHDDADIKYRDKIKESFAKSNGLTLYRITGLKNIKHLLEERIGLKLSDVRPKKLISEFNILRDMRNGVGKRNKIQPKKKRNVGNKFKRK